MKENFDKLDRFFEDAFAGFEESPPTEVKNSVFRRMLLFNTWRSIRKYVIVFLILLMASGIAYFSASLSSGKSGLFNQQKSSLDKKESNPSMAQKTKTVNALMPSVVNKNEVADLRLKKPVNAATVSHEINTTPKLYQNKSPSANPEKKSSEKNSNNKPIQYDKSNTSQSIALNATHNSPLKQNKITENVNENTDKSVTGRINNPDNLSDISETTSTQTSEDLITDDAENYTASSEKSVINKNSKTPLLWSIGLNVGHSLIQSNLINTSEQTPDENFRMNSKLNFPSGFVGLNVRGERKHLFFEFGLQYSNFSEKISTNQLLYNSSEYPNIDCIGQNTVRDTNGGYWHYYYISTTKIIKHDSVWTWRIDSSLVNIYDTTYKQRYDTLNSPSWINTYYLVELPMNIGWMKNFNKVHLGFSTGPIISLLVGTKGKMPYNKNETEIIATKQEFQRFKFAISWQISGIIDYQFSKRMLVEFSPYYRYTLLPYKSSASSATLKNNSLGLQVGLRYYF
jgi:hypothetical protein